MARKALVRYSKVMANRILKHVEEGGNLREFCRKNGAPSTWAVNDWRKRPSCKVNVGSGSDIEETSFGDAFWTAEAIRISSRVEYLIESMSEDGYQFLKDKLGREPTQLELRSDEARRRREIDTVKFLAAREIASHAKRIKVEHSGEVSTGLQINLINYNGEDTQSGEVIDLQPDELKLTLGNEPLGDDK